MRTLRLLGVGWLYHLKMISRSPFEGFGQVLWPLFFATVAFLVFRAGHSPRTLIYASLGSAVMGMWSATSTTAGGAMQRERWHGTLELLVATPPHFSLILLPIFVLLRAFSFCFLRQFGPEYDVWQGTPQPEPPPIIPSPPPIPPPLPD